MVKVFRSLIYTRNYGESINPVHEYKVNTTRRRLPSTARRLYGAGRGNPPPIHAQFSCTIELVTAPFADAGTICASDPQGFALRAKRFAVHVNRDLNRGELHFQRASRSVALLRQQ